MRKDQQKITVSRRLRAEGHLFYFLCFFIALFLYWLINRVERLTGALECKKNKDLGPLRDVHYIDKLKFSFAN